MGRARKRAEKRWLMVAMAGHEHDPFAPAPSTSSNHNTPLSPLPFVVELTQRALRETIFSPIYQLELALRVPGSVSPKSRRAAEKLLQRSASEIPSEFRTPCRGAN